MTKFDQFKEIIKILRREGGCPWDQEQTHSSLKPACIEELGDLLLQVVMHAQIAEEEGLFTIEDVIQEISEKMIRRHPHVFQEANVSDSKEVLVRWEQIKKEEKEGKDWMDAYLPRAFDEAERLIERARKRKGFDR